MIAGNIPGYTLKCKHLHEDRITACSIVSKRIVCSAIRASRKLRRLALTSPEPTLENSWTGHWACVLSANTGHRRR